MAATEVPAYPARQVDPTGAGDVFAVAYLVSYFESRDPFASALFASCVASLSVEAMGLASVPTREQIEKKMAKFPYLECRPLNTTGPEVLDVQTRTQ